MMVVEGKIVKPVPWVCKGISHQSINCKGAIAEEIRENPLKNPKA